MATWTVAATAAEADALATCLFLVPTAQLAAEFQLSYLVLHRDLTASKSADFPAAIFERHA